MNRDELLDSTLCKILVNHEGQYGIVPNDGEVPVGWRDTGQSGTRQACLAYVEEAHAATSPHHPARSSPVNTNVFR